MRPNYNGLIPIAAGVYILLAAFRFIPLSKNPEANELWLRRFGLWMKVLSPILIVCGLLELAGLLR